MNIIQNFGEKFPYNQYVCLSFYSILAFPEIEKELCKLTILGSVPQVNVLTRTFFQWYKDDS